MSESLFPTRWAEDRPPSLEKFTSDFADDYACAEYLAKKRWRSGFKCPKCGGNRAWRLEARPWVWECQGVWEDAKGERTRTGCRHQTSLIAGTVMHGTHLPLRKWFLAAYLMATHSNGMSALQLQAKVGITSYKSAWLLLHKLRRAMVDPNRRPLRGDVDIYCNEFVFRWNRRRSFQTSIDTLLGLGQKIGPITWRGIVGDTRKWKHEHRTQVLNMVDPERLKRAQEYAFENGMDIFDALDDIRRDEERHVYARRKPMRPALPPRRTGEERDTRRYVHPPSLAPAEIAAGYLRHIPVGSKITGTRQYASI